MPKFRCLRCDNCKRTIEDELNGKRDQGDSSNGIHENPMLDDTLNRFQVDLNKHIVVENDTDDDNGNAYIPNECTNANPMIDESNVNNIGNYSSSKLDMGKVVVATKEDNMIRSITEHGLLKLDGKMVTPANKKITSKGCGRKRKPLQVVKLKAVHVPLQREDNEKVENLSNMPLSAASPFPRTLQEDTSKSILKGNNDESNSLGEQSISLTRIKNDFLIKGKGVVNEEIIGVTDKDISSKDMEIGNTENAIALMTEDNDSDNEIMEITEVMTITIPGHVNCHQKSLYEKEETQEDEEEIEEIPRKEKASIINDILVDYFFLYNGKRYRMNQNPYLVHSSSIMLEDFPSSGVHISQVDTWGLVMIKLLVHLA
ncbi:hypothetical protein RJT34_15928 [Clitoria ternatea]|uniref:Uncharacterized protein n=1 Tax=Clitoria ternatea TaxID=43366 RepID=A0AAN9J6B0_CLITE